MPSTAHEVSLNIAKLLSFFVSKEVIQPIIEEAVVFERMVDNSFAVNPAFELTPYGHAAASLSAILNANRYYDTPEEAAAKQRELMLLKVNELVYKFGPQIVTYLTEEMKLAYTFSLQEQNP